MILARIKQFILYQKLKTFLERYERFLMPATLIAGTALDAITFRSIRIDTFFLILGVYLVIVVATIVIMNMDEKHVLLQKGKAFSYARLIAPLVFQFLIGNLLSASLVFYWFGGAISASWPILLVIMLFMISNEVFRRAFQRPVVQMSLFFFILFSVASLFFPFLFNSIDVKIFLLAGGVSLICFFLFTNILSRFIQRIKRARFFIAISVLSIFAVMNALYFLNVIPPIPLSLREAGVYHSVERISGGYRLQGEFESWFDRFIFGETIRLQAGDRLFVFSSIFAPAQLHTTIVHHWEFFDESKHEWIDKDYLSFSLNGGRSEGYRGYTMKSSVAPGKWRVSVETARGQVLGRVLFEVVSVVVRPKLIEIIK